MDSAARVPDNWRKLNTYEAQFVSRDITERTLDDNRATAFTNREGKGRVLLVENFELRIGRRFRESEQMNWRIVAFVLAIFSQPPSVAVAAAISRDDRQPTCRLVHVEAMAVR